MTATFSTKTAATAAARDAGLKDGEFTVTKGDAGWNYAPKEAALTPALNPPMGEQEIERQDGDQGGETGASQQDGTSAEGQTTEQPQSEPAKTGPVVTFTGSAFPSIDHAVAWAKCDGFARNRIKVEAVEGGFLFRPLAEGEKYVAIGSTPRTGNGPAFPAPGTKKRMLIDLVCRAEGATMTELETALGWKKCSGTLNELDETFGLELEYRKKGKEGRYFGTFPAAYATPEPAGEQQQADEQGQREPLAA
ncbi:DUF3489 domain-containing protein [Azospirillum sp. Sh1]|uniref:DUF3489 domain-containing protein n=1 Tax=Azospirillum sp. Sh1 TaxID=2607285 RepID=UPI0011ED18B3|nr:DUF3489 domain-containing protein [Azospirillum sp. Sh1]KAA0576692.1 DUF3489 domain-containing protein [Azospirillum sp. Sh1]